MVMVMVTVMVMLLLLLMMTMMRMMTMMAVTDAKQKEQEPDGLWCLELLEKTGIVTVPGSGFGQMDGSYHFRTTILPPDELLEEVVKKLTVFQEDFMKKYGDCNGSNGSGSRPKHATNRHHFTSKSHSCGAMRRGMQQGNSYVEVREVGQQGPLGKLCGSLCISCLGVVMYWGSLVLLAMNEQSTVCTQRALISAANIYQEVSCDGRSAGAELQNSAIFFSCPFAEESLVSRAPKDFGAKDMLGEAFRVKAVKVRQDVQMLQCVETKTTEQRKEGDRTIKVAEPVAEVLRAKSCPPVLNLCFPVKTLTVPKDATSLDFVYEQKRLALQVSKLQERSQLLSTSGGPTGPNEIDAPRVQEIPSLGSYGHPNICRRPCILLVKGTCHKGSACGFCHFEHDAQRNFSEAVI
eukprot:s934_g15.t1